MAKKQTKQRNEPSVNKSKKQLVLRSTYVSDLKKVGSYPDYKKNVGLLEEYFELLQNGQPLPQKAKDHKMAKHSPGELRFCRDFHLTPDIVVIYRNDGESIEIIHIGKHNNMRLTSSLNLKELK